MNEPMFSLLQFREGAARRSFAVPGGQRARAAESAVETPGRRIAPLARPAAT